MAGYNFRAFQYAFEPNIYDAGVKSLDDLSTSLDEMRAHIKKYPNELGVMSGDVNEIEKMAQEYKRLTSEIKKVADQTKGHIATVERLAQQIEIKLDEYWGDSVKALIAVELNNRDIPRLERRINRLMAQFDSFRGIGKSDVATFASSRMATAAQRDEITTLAYENMKLLEDVMTEINASTTVPYFKNLSQSMLNDIYEYRKEMRTLMILYQNVGNLGAQRTTFFFDMLTKLENLIDESNAQLEQITKKTTSRQNDAIWFAVIALILTIVLALVYVNVFDKKLIAKIKHVISNLDASADNVSGASKEISSSSHGLASGATEQAASLEEISASLNEITSMLKQTAQSMDGLNQTAKVNVEQSETNQKEMSNLKTAVAEIQRASNETAKILKDIDDIAFQTNLLALNAAVEAARAGEAGKGFAVVAEEVRNLAQRSAESAKKTATLVENSLQSSANGVELVGKVEVVIQRVAESSTKTVAVISDISSAINQQSKAIDQVNTAMGTMDQVTQANASQSEELAASSQELSSQASLVNNTVDELVGAVDGKKAQEERAQSHKSQRFTAGSISMSDNRREIKLLS
jgi:methyl-accepting chemotaxis protein